MSPVEGRSLSGDILKPTDYSIGFPISLLDLSTCCSRPSNGICQNGIEQVCQVPSGPPALQDEPPGENLLCQCENPDVADAGASTRQGPGI